MILIKGKDCRVSVISRFDIWIGNKVDIHVKLARQGKLDYDI